MFHTKQKSRFRSNTAMIRKIPFGGSDAERGRATGAIQVPSTRRVLQIASRRWIDANL